MSPTLFVDGFAAAIAQHPLVALLVALGAGVFSTTLCPCTLPTGVGLAGFVGTGDERAANTGVLATHVDSAHGARGRRAALSLAFFAGIVLSIVALGTVAAVIGRVLTRWDAAFAAGAGVVTLAAGLAALFAPALRRRVPDPDIRQRGGMVGAFAYGALYSVATVTTSAGPLLLLLTLAAAIGQPLYGAGLSLAYGIGRGLPFLGIGLLAERVGAWLQRVERARRPVEIASGIALVGLSAYFVRLAVVLA